MGMIPANSRRASTELEKHQQGIAYSSIRYTLSKKMAIAEDVAAGFSQREVATRHGVALATVSAVTNDQSIQDLITPEMVERRRRSMAKIYEYQADQAMGALTPDKFEKASVSQLVMAAAVCTDKARLLRGESTENVSLRGVVGDFSNFLTDLKQKKDLIASKCGITDTGTRESAYNEPDNGGKLALSDGEKGESVDNQQVSGEK